MFRVCRASSYVDPLVCPSVCTSVNALFGLLLPTFAVLQPCFSSLIFTSLPLNAQGGYDTPGLIESAREVEKGGSEGGIDDEEDGKIPRSSLGSLAGRASESREGGTDSGKGGQMRWASFCGRERKINDFVAKMMQYLRGQRCALQFLFLIPYNV